MAGRREDTRAFPQRRQRVAQVMVDEVQKHEVDRPLPDRKRLSRCAKPSDQMSLGTCDRNCEHSLRWVNAVYACVKHLPQELRKSPNAASQIDDCADITALKFASQKGRPNAYPLVGQRPGRRVGSGDIVAS